MFTSDNASGNGVPDLTAHSIEDVGIVRIPHHDGPRPPRDRVGEHPPVDRIIVHDQHIHSCQIGGLHRGARQRPSIVPDSAVKWSRFPAPDSLSTQIRPFIIYHRREEIASPAAAPCLRVVDASACTKASKIAACFSTRTRYPVSETVEIQHELSGPHRLHTHLHADFAALRKLDRVAAKI